MRIFVILFYCVFSMSCNGKASNAEKEMSSFQKKESKSATVSDTLSKTKTIHIFVALCDNKYQGIVPVPARIGNGQDPSTNLYWGCGFGIKTYFKKSKEWKLLETTKPGNNILERLVFKSTVKSNYYLVGDAYDGQYIKQCTKDFLNSISGQRKSVLKISKENIGIGGNASLLGYIGHDGLMDFQLSEKFDNADGKERNIIVLACYSKRFFASHLKSAKVNPIVWTSNLMCPEAYTIHDAIAGYIAGENNEKIRTRAVKAYNKYQKCGEKGARNLLVTGF